MVVITKSLYEELAEQYGLEKAMGHKYVKRVPKKSGKGYIYYYSDGHGGLVAGKPPKQGAKPHHFTPTEKKPLPSTVINGDKVKFNTGSGAMTGIVTGTSPEEINVKGKDGKSYRVPRTAVKNVLHKVNAKDEIRNLYDTAHIKGGWRNGENGIQPESCDTWEGITKAATADSPAFAAYDEKIEDAFKATIGAKLFKRNGLKKQERAFEKLRDDEQAHKKHCKATGKEYKPEVYNEETDTYHCRTLRDVDGHTFCCKNIEDVSKMLAYFDKQPEIIRIKNNFAKPSPVGYSDINMNIRLPGGTVAEIQLNTMANMVAKENYGHALYEVWRSINGNPQFKNVADAMGEAQKKLYKLSNDYSKNGNFPAEIESPFNAKHQSYADAIRADLRKALPGIEMAYNAGAIDEKTHSHIQDLLKKIG